MCYARAQYSFAATSPHRPAFAGVARRCLEKFTQFTNHRVEHLAVPFDDHHVFALMHTAETARPAPAVVLIPGMDMVKEDYTYFAEQLYTSHGIHAIAIDGPGQGESLTGGLRVTVDNYERAVSTVIDLLVRRPEVDADRIAVWGVSMGAYWALRAAAHDRRLKAAATTVGFYGDVDTLFGRAQPSYKRNYMGMAGYEDASAFDADIAEHMGLDGLSERITCPVLFSFGEFDELSNLPDAVRAFDKIQAPKEMFVWEDEFHPLGRVLPEALRIGRSWISRALGGGFAPGHDFRVYTHRDGRAVPGTGLPPWWSPAPGRDA